MLPSNTYSFQEFFAGGGMVRQALGLNWNCVFANDFDGKKALAYQENWGCMGELIVDDIKNIDASKIGNNVDLSWASFPCQDLSLAGAGRGLDSSRSGMFFVFWEKLKRASIDGEFPKVVIVENVTGMLSSNQGRDFQTVVKTFVDNGYRVGGLVIDAKEFVPQSRKRIFIVGVRKDIEVSASLVKKFPSSVFHSNLLVRAHSCLSPSEKEDWIWFDLPSPKKNNSSLIDLLESENLVTWNSADKTKSILNRMSALNIAKVDLAKKSQRPEVGALFLRTRKHGNEKRVFAEVRFDGISGCLRTPNGGSSRQSIILINGDHIRSRLLTPRETARLMGLPECYKLPKNSNSALHLTGDGVVVPVVEHLKVNLIEPLVSGVESFNTQHQHMYA